MKTKTKYSFIFIFFLLLLNSACPALETKKSISVDTLKLPLIQEPTSKDLMFRQFGEEADFNSKVYANTGKNLSTQNANPKNRYEQPIYTFYKLVVPKGMDFMWLSARLSPVYKETIATLNHLTGADQKIEGKTLLVSTFSGIFVPQKPASPWEFLLHKQYLTDGKIADSIEFNIDGKIYYFLERERFDNSTYLFFVDTNMITPLKQSVLTSEYGYRISPISGKWKFHSGIDLAASEGTDVFACKAGEVTYTGFNATYGNYIIITHYNGMKSIYAHLSRITAQRGQKINGGTLIGKVGTTGMSTGPHLHFELIKNGSSTDPEKLLNIR